MDRTRRRSDRLWLSLGLAVVVGFMLAPSFALKTSVLDEGILLAMPVRVLEGDVPGRDFETFYGPASHYVIAGAFAIFGDGLAVERAVGLAYRLIVALALFWIVLPWGRWTALACGLAAGIGLAATGLPAFAWMGALASMTAGLALGLAASRHEIAEERRRWLALAAGILSGAALLFRFDFPAALLFAGLALAVGNSALPWRRFVLGAVAAAALYVPYLAVIGWSAVDRTLRHLSDVSDGRDHPFPSVASADAALLAATVAAIVAAVVIGLVRVRRDAGDLGARGLLVIGAMLVGLLHYVFNRPDTIHIGFVACVALALVPLFAALAVRAVRPAWTELRVQTGLVAAVVVLGAAVFAVDPPDRRLTERLGLEDPVTHRVEHEGRWYLESNPEAASDLRRLLPVVDRLLGDDGRLFVGQKDLRRADYNDTVVYYLLRNAEPASRYLELSPGGANSEGSGLAQALRQADVLLLTNRHDFVGVNPDSEHVIGSNAPSEVVDERFCERGTSGTYVVLAPCDQPS